jgi:uncharacterized membrane protein YhaH (DUF805 family)
MTRSDFWFLHLYLIVLLTLNCIFFLTLASVFNEPGILGGFYISIFLAWLCLPSANARRLHDVGKSGWWQLVPIYSLILFLMPSINENSSSTEANYKI